MVKPYTMIVHPATLHQLELALGSICTFTTSVDAEGAKSYEVTQVNKSGPTFNQLGLLDTVSAVRFIPIRDIARQLLSSQPECSPVKAASHQNMQDLCKFLRLDRRACR